MEHYNLYNQLNEALITIYEGKTPKFQKGDKVKINLKGNQFDGKIGIIIKVMPTRSTKETAQNQYKVEVDKKPLTYLENELSPAD